MQGFDPEQSQRKYSKWKITLMVKKLAVPYLRHVLFMNSQKKVDLVASRNLYCQSPLAGGPSRRSPPPGFLGLLLLPRLSSLSGEDGPI